MEMLLSGFTVTGLEAVAWVVAVLAGVALLLSPRAPRLGSHLGWAYPTAMAVTSVALLVADTAWWLTRSDPRAAAVAGVAGQSPQQRQQPRPRHWTIGLSPVSPSRLRQPAMHPDRGQHHLP